MSDDEYRTMFAVVEYLGELKVTEVMAMPTTDGWTIRQKRGRSVWFDFAPAGKLYETREKAEARLKEIQAGG